MYRVANRTVATNATAHEPLDEPVFSSDGEDVGQISDIMFNVRSGRVAYTVLSEGGFLGMGAILHAIPWNALTLDKDAKCFRVSIDA
ncbi:sporulation protein YlmC with PRC-barrel domain [Paraburkholderia sp. WSM4179]|nr:sporulation protein YlmC with PRC-barrel domain [Paraburkholderia sp. WSM4179]